MKDDVSIERSIGKKVDPVTGGLFVISTFCVVWIVESEQCVIDVYHVTYDMPGNPEIVNRLVDGVNEKEQTERLMEYRRHVE